MQYKGNYWLWLVMAFVVFWVVMNFREMPIRQIEAPDDRWFQSEVLSQDRPVLVKFGAEWCGPCRAMQPTLKELSHSMGSRLKIVDIDVDEHSELAKHYRISTIPHLLLFDQGKIVADRRGADTRENLEKWIDEHSKK